MAESAYYRCVLWSGMVVPPPSGRILSEHASFEAGWKVERESVRRRRLSPITRLR